MKTEIIIEEDGKILSISRSHRGRIYDFRIRKQEKFLPRDSIKYAILDIKDGKSCRVML